MKFFFSFKYLVAWLPMFLSQWDSRMKIKMSKIWLSIDLAIRHTLHKFFLYNWHHEKHLNYILELFNRRYLDFLLGQRKRNKILEGKKVEKAIIQKSIKTFKTPKRKIPFVFKMTNLCCFSNGYKSQMLALLWQGNISIMRLNMLLCTFAKALLTPADLPAIHFPETVEWNDNIYI